MTTTYRVDGVPLNDPDGRWTLLDGTLFGMGASRSVTNVTVPGMDGAIVAGLSSLQTMALTFQMEVVSESTHGLSRNLGALTSLLSAPSMTVTRVVDDIDMTARACGDSVSAAEFFPAANMCRFTATLRIPGVFWRGLSADWTISGVMSGVTYPVSTLDESSGSIRDALILIDGPVTNPTIRSGDSWASLAIALMAGESALIDCDAWTVRSGVGVTFDGGGSAASGLLTASVGPYLLPLTPQMAGTDPTTTRVSISMEGSGMNSSTTVGVRAAPAFLV